MTNIKPIKLLLAAPTFYPAYGGAELRFSRYLKYFKKYNIEPTIITGTPKGKKLSPEDKQSDWYVTKPGTELPLEHIGDVSVNRYRLPDKPAKKRITMFYSKICDYLENNNNDIDIIQLLAPLPYFTNSFLRKIKRQNIPIVYAYTLPKLEKKSYIHKYIDSVRFKSLFSMLDCVVASSDETKEILVQNKASCRLEVVPNGVDTNVFYPSKNISEKLSIKKKLNINLEKIILLNVASIHPRKGTDHLLRSFMQISKNLQNVELYILGQRADLRDPKLTRFNNGIEKLLNTTELRNKVHLKGLVQNVEEYMRAADIFIFPSKREGMGNVVLEAMASKLPCVLTPYLGLPSSFGKDETHYLLSDFSDDALTNDILKLISSNSLKDNLAENAYQYITSNMKMENAALAYANLYNSLL